MKRIPYIDMHDVGEEDRIAAIGERAALKLVGVLLETNEPAKIERYIRKVTKRYPKVRHVDTTPGLTPLVSIVRFGPKLPS